MNFINSDIIVNNVKNRLSTYFAQGSIDETHLYKAIKSCLDRMGAKAHALKSTHLKLQNKQAELPSDFFKLVSLVGVNKVEYWDIDPQESVLLKSHERMVVEIPNCKTACDYCTDSCGNLVEFVQEFELHKVKYSELFEVKVDSRLDNKSISIRNGMIFANFSGDIYLEYLSQHWNGESFEIPDYTQITDWIETAMEVECLEFLYLNQVTDAIQRLQYLQNKLAEKYITARSFYKMLEVSELYDVKKALNYRFSAYRNQIKSSSNSYL